MGYPGGPNQFPVFLKAQTDGSTTAEIRKFEDFVTSSMGRAAKSAEAAGKAADQGFNFAGARKAVDQLQSEIQRVGKIQSQRISDPFGIAGSLSSLRSSPLQQMLSQQASAEASLDAQRQREHANRMAAIQQEFDAAIGAVRSRRAAELAAVDDIIARNNSLVQLEQQRVAAQAQLVGGRTFIQAPGFDPQAATQDAAAAQRHAAALNQLASAAERVAAAESGATTTDRAYAATLRASATAAQEEAVRLAELAATQTRVAGSITGLNKANLDLQSSQRAGRFATIQASQQFQDFFIQIGAGTNPVIAFTQQASQLAFVMSYAGGTAGRLARFMAGGGGTVAFAALAIIPLIGTLVGKFLDQNAAVDKAVEKMRKDADQADANIDANKRWAASIDGVVDAIRKQREELDREQKSAGDTAAAAVVEASKNLQALNQGIQKAKQEFASLGGDTKIGDLQKTIAGVRAQAGSGDPGAVAASTAILEQQLSKLQAVKDHIVDLQKRIAVAESNVTDSTVQLGVEQGKALADLTANAALWNKRYMSALTGKGGIFDRHPELASASTEILASVERVSQAMQHAASAKAPFGNVQAEAKKLGVQFDQGKLAPAQYAAALDKLAASLEAVAKAAEEARKETGKAFTDFNLPVQGKITGTFGEKRPGHTHQGVDIAVPVGTNVQAAAAGTVIEVGTLPGYGNVVVINHGNGTLTKYAHLSKLLAQKGESVTQGQVIGLSGGAAGAAGAGDSTGPHVHYEVVSGGHPVNPLKGRYQTDDMAAAQQAATDQQRLAEASQRAAEQARTEQEKLGNESDSLAERVQRINEQWNIQPKLIDQAAQAHRTLNETVKQALQLQSDYTAEIAKLEQQKPPGWQDTVKQLEASRDALNGVITAAQAAGPVIDEGMVKPLTEYVRNAQEAKQIDDLILAGHQDQADALREVLDLQRQMGPLTTAQVKDVLAVVEAERRRKLELQEQDRLIQRAVSSANTVQNALTGIIANPFDLKNIKSQLSSVFDDFRQNFARSISEALLGGDLGTQMEQALRAKTDPLGQAGSDLTQSAGDLSSAASDLVKAASTLSAPGGATPGALQATPTAFGVDDAFTRETTSLLSSIGAATSSSAVGTTDLATILQHQTDLQKRSALLANPEQYYNLLGGQIGGSLDKVFGTNFFDKIGGKLGTALEGAQVGQVTGQVFSALGLKGQSQLGSSIGGAIGAVVGSIIPGVGTLLGSVVGSALGGIVGSLFGKKSHTGFSSVGADSSGALDVGGTGGNSQKRISESTKDINAAIDEIEALAAQFGTLADASKAAGSIAIKNDNFIFDPTGAGRTKGAGTINFGQDEQAAVEAAVKQMIEEGVLGPIRDGTKKLLLNARTLQSGIEKAIKFEDVFKELKQYTDPVGAALDALNIQFEQLKQIFAEAGASAEEYAQLEQLYQFKRADAIKQATQQLDGTLTQLLKDLTYSGDTGLSLRTREAAAKAQLAPFQQAIAAGQPIDQEAFAQVVQSLLEIEREMYGSTAQYFDMLQLLTALTQQAIANTGQAQSVPAVTGAPSGVPIATGYPAPTGDVSGIPITGGPSLPITQASNDNMAAAAQTVGAIDKQTQQLQSAGLTSEGITAAIETALLNVAEGQDASGRTVFMLKPLIDQVTISNGQVVSKLGDILQANQQGNQILTQGFLRLPGAGDNGPANEDNPFGIYGPPPLYLSSWQG